MSKIPVDKNGKLRTLELRGVYSTTKLKSLDTTETLDVTKPTVIADKSQHTETKPQNNVKDQGFCKAYVSFIPKMNLNIEKVIEKNPRILDLREKLNQITKKQDCNVDKKTKGLINDITQQLVDKTDEEDSGPYSLLFDLQQETASTSLIDSAEVNIWTRPKSEVLEGNSAKIKFNPINKSTDRLPNVLNFDEKLMREFEYSCENEYHFPSKRTFNTHSRSELCLQLKSHAHPRIFEPNQSPNDNSLSRTNEENSLDDSLGILTPDQMDDICYLENAFSPTVEGLPIFCENERKISPDNGDTPSTDKTESNSAASTIQNDGFDSVESKKSTLEDQLAPIETIITNEDHNSIISPEISQLHCNESYSIEASLPQIAIESLNLPQTISNKVKEEVASTLIDEEFLPSMHSSILEPVSSIAENIANLEIALDCKHNNLIMTNRIEQTPSPEDLPLDSSELNGEISTYSQFSASTLHDSQTFSDGKNDYPKSMETSKVSNSFITSITSITSLDGYQGDGEMSRPVSRGADHSIEHREDVIEMDWQNVPVTRRPDPMTDSDFFTESDADGLDDHMQRGDRRAQVIDGALYGGKKTNGNPPLIVNRNEDSCMESSGVYTDFETHRTSPVFLNVIDDMSPDGSTPSTRSECSQKNISTNNINAYLSPLQDTSHEQKLESSHVSDNDETPKNSSKRSSLNSVKDLKSIEKKEEKRFTLKKYKMPKRDVPSKLKSMLASRKTEVDNSVQNSPKTVKKPDRRENLAKKNSLDVKSDYKKSFKDIKSKVDCSFSLQRSQTSCSVNRMLSSKSTSNNVKPKSRHMRMRMDLGSATGSGKSSLHSSQSDISASSTPLGKHATSRFPLLRNGKKRESAPTPTTPRPPPPATPPTPQNVQTKKNGVVPKLSSSPVAARARTSLAPPPSPRKAPPHRVPAQRPSTLPTNKEPPRVTAAVGPRGKRVQTPQPVKSPPVALTAPLPAQPREQVAALAHAAKGVEALGVLVQYLVFRLDALNGSTWRKEAERWRGVAAAERTSAARADRDRQQRAQKDLDTIAECLSKISELEMEVSSKEEANARLQAKHVEEVAALATDIKDLKDTIESLKHEVAESRARLHAHSEIERTLRAQLEAARAELDKQHNDSCATLCDTSGDTLHDTSYVSSRNISHSTSRDASSETSYTSRDVSCDTSYNTSYNTCDAACDPVCCEAEDCELRLAADEELSTDANELAAEVRSLRAVVELKQAEIASLRDARTELAGERARRAAAEREARAARHAAEELRERAAGRARDADRLRDEHRRLREQAARDRDHAARLAALNEELRYKLRQKSQVVSLLAGGGYVERASLRTRSSSNESGRSSPAPDSPPSPAASPAPDSPPLPAVKGVVEKHDSVSWVLEIEETPEEVASRLARRSSFRATASPGGVKRRGGGSPGGGSPAPASPAPNASKLFRPGDLDFPPAPPPLKESAGEAIYIYDDRQY